MSLNKVFEKNYFKASGLYFIGNIFNKAISLLLLPIFTRLLATDAYGIVSTYNSWVSIATIIISLQLFSTYRSAYLDYKNNLNEYTSAINSIVVVCFVAVFGLSMLITTVFQIKVSRDLIMLCLIHSFMASILNIETQKEMMELRYVKRTLLLSLPNLIAAVAGIVVLYLLPESSYYGRIVPTVIVHCCFGCTLLILGYAKGKTFYNKKIWTYAISYSAPLIVHGLANTVLSSLDRTMITAMRSSSETGIYSVAYTLGMMVLVITSSLEAVWIPWFTKKMEKGDKSIINTYAKVYVLVVAVLCVICELCLPEILKLFTDRSYWGGIAIIPPVVLASFSMFLYSLSVDLEYLKKTTKGIAINTIVAAILNSLLNYIFIPKYGAIAAAFTTVASYFVSFVLHYIYARKLDSELFPFSIYVLPIIIVIAGTAFVYFFMENWCVRWCSTFFLMIVMCVWCMKKYKGVLNG